METRNYILTVKQKFSDFPLLRSLRYKIGIFEAYVQKQWGKKEGCGCGPGPCLWVTIVIFSPTSIHIFTHVNLHSSHILTHPIIWNFQFIQSEHVRFEHISIQLDAGASAPQPSTKNKSFSKETLSGLSLLIEKKTDAIILSTFSAVFWSFPFRSFPRRPYLSPYISLSRLAFIHWKISEVLCRHFNW